MKEDKEKLRAWVESWKRTGKVLERLQRDEIENSNLADSIRSFDLALKSALWLEPAKPYSGLVEYHKILSKLR
jgi:hypothetical protein